MISTVPTLQPVAKVIQAALECSLFIAPREPGLTYQELIEVGRQLGFKDGELNDVLHRATNYAAGFRRLLPDHGTLEIFLFREEPDYRNFDALDFVLSEMNEAMRETGGKAARLDRDVLIERAVGAGLARDQAEAAVTVLVWADQLVETNGVLSSKWGNLYQPLPTEQRNQPGAVRHVSQRPERARAYPVVEDIVSRRTDGRLPSIEPLDAFAEQIDRLGYGRFRMWWVQTVRELRQCQPHATPVAACVLSAALVEGALTFVVNHARKSNLAVFQSSDFSRDPKTWRIDDLVASAATGGAGAILDSQQRSRADALIRARQRIHAGRILSDYPSGVPDLRPDEARDAKITAEVVVRAVLDWLERFPPTP